MDARRWLVGASVPALLVALATASHAADVMPLPAEDAGPPIYDWSGFYIGGHLGYLGLDSDALRDVRALPCAAQLPRRCRGAGIGSSAMGFRAST